MAAAMCMGVNEFCEHDSMRYQQMWTIVMQAHLGACLDLGASLEQLGNNIGVVERGGNVESSATLQNSTRVERTQAPAHVWLTKSRSGISSLGLSDRR